MNPPRPRSHGVGPRCARLIAVATAAAAASLFGAPAATAANDYLELSLDGQQFSTTLSGSLFTDNVTYIPGASTRATLWVRNNGEEAAALTSAAVVTRADPELTGYLGLQAASSSQQSVRSALGPQDSCTDVQQMWDLGAGESVQLTFVLDLSADASNETMNREAAFDVRFLLQSQGTGTATRGACALPWTADNDAGDGDGAAGTGDGAAENPAVPAAAESPIAAATITGVPDGQPVSPVFQPAGNAGAAEAQTLPQVTVPENSPPSEGIVQAVYASNVEPVIRSLSGTLLIVMSVVFTAAVILRIRNRQA